MLRSLRDRLSNFVAQTLNGAWQQSVNVALTPVGGLVHNAQDYPILGSGNERTMSRNDLVLALLASADGRSFSPAQLQKTAFLITSNIPNIVTEGPGFTFRPYDYGPFDSAVYSEAKTLRDADDVTITPSPWGRWVTYAASPRGVGRGREILNGLPEQTREYIRNVANWALGQSFNSLVKAIYDHYPEMRVNSIFRDPA